MAAYLRELTAKLLLEVRTVTRFDSMQTPLADQEGPKLGTSSFFEMLSSREIAYHMTCYDWELFNCVHEVTDWSVL